MTESVSSSPLPTAPRAASTRFHYAMLFLAAVASITAAVYSATTASTLRDSILMVTHTLNVQKNISALLAESQDVETHGLRYMLGLRPEFLRDHQLARRGLDDQLAQLAALTIDNRAQWPKIKALRDAIEQRNHWFDGGIAVAEAGPIQAAAARVREGTGALFMTDIRTLATAMAHEEAELLVGRQKTLDQTIIQTTTTTLLVNVLALIVGGIALASLRRGAIAVESSRVALIEAEQSARIGREKSDFLASMSHEIRTPMNAVFGFSQLLAKTKIEPEAREYIKAIQTSGRALLALINDILDLSKIEAGKLPLALQATDIRELLESTLGVFAETASQKQLQLRLRVAPEVPITLVVDPHRLRQILMNLISNAVKYSDRGVVRVNATSVTTAELRCDLTIAIADEGIGIAADRQAKLFEPFYRAVGDADGREGTGLGLAIVRRLLALMRGDISLQSAPGSGSTFTIVLHDVEVSTEVAHPLDEDEQSINFARLKPSRILIVDDVPWNRDLLAAFMAEGDHQVAFACNGEEAILAATQHQPDLVLMDLRMPVLDGREATRRIRKTPGLERVKVIAVSASSMSREERDIGSADSGSDFDAYIRKPVAREVLFHAMVEHLGLQMQPTTDVAAVSEMSSPQSSRLEPVADGARKAAISRLQHIVDVELANIQATLRVAEIRKLADELAVLGSRGGFPAISYFSRRLLAAVERFDVMQMESLLHQLNEHVQSTVQAADVQ
ncbi:MAG: ATP-binding protein [Pseudomarimonas sp.]